MDLYLKQHVFTWGDRFTVYDAAGADAFYVEGEVFTFGKKLHLYDTSMNELLYIKQEVWSFLPRYMIYRGERQIAEVVREFSFFRPRYTVEGTGWEIEGEVLAHEFEIRQGDAAIASVSKEWFTFGDAYHISISDRADAVLVLASVLAIDAGMDNN